MLVKQQNFSQLINNVYQTYYLLQQSVQKAVNHFLAIKNWMTGFYIVEYKQKMTKIVPNMEND
jgi:hypothetical protein